MTAETNNVVDFSMRSAENSVAEEFRDVPPPVSQKHNLKSPPKNGIALALGGGAARGWAHIGVMRAIDEANIPVSMIAGTSIGALVGGCYLAGKLDELEEFARSITRRNILRYMDFAFKASGLISGKRLADRMDTEIGDINIEELDRRFIAIATDIKSGNEVWLEHGPLSDAIRASYALPGVFQPVKHFGRMMVDGALVNPVPVSACRAFEQRVVVAVNLSSEVFGRSAVVRSKTYEDDGFEVALPASQDNASAQSWFQFGFRGEQSIETNRDRLGFTGVMIESFNIIQDKIIRSRLAGDPPDFTIRPRLVDIGLSDFHKAEESIALGYEVARLKLAALEERGLRTALEV